MTGPGLRVYVAGPYTKGDVVGNVRTAVLAGSAIAAAGHHPFIPHLSHLWHTIDPHPYEFWIAQDNAWIVVCDVLVRLPGESPGADAEVELARLVGLPVFYDVDAFLAKYGNLG